MLTRLATGAIKTLGSGASAVPLRMMATSAPSDLIISHDKINQKFKLKPSEDQPEAFVEYEPAGQQCEEGVSCWVSSKHHDGVVRICRRERIRSEVFHHGFIPYLRSDRLPGQGERCFPGLTRPCISGFLQGYAGIVVQAAFDYARENG